MAPTGGKLRFGFALGAAVGACAGRGPLAPADGAGLEGALQTPGLRGLDDPSVRGARLLPAGLDEAHVWGIEPGGAARAIVAGLRVLSFPAGNLTAALGRLPASPSDVAEVPERLGGGFLMAIGSSLWRAPTWLGPAAPVFTHPAPITEIIVGLDRVYLRGTQGPVSAVDARTGTRLGLGPLPSSPRIASVAALDAWRAAAIADLRGTLITLDAGASWRPISLPIEPSRAIARGDAFLVGGLDHARSTQWWEVLPNGQTGWLTSAPVPRSAAERGPIAPPPNLPPLGERPLQAAVEDGWPLVDGTALVARDGFLVRVRLADGTVAERVPDAFALRPARCHPLAMPRPDDASAFGFVCGQPGGRTAIFRWNAVASRLSEIRRFDAPREVLASGNGGLVVRGECATSGVEHLGDGRAFCVMNPNGRWREARLQAGLERARPVALSSGRLALVGPPESGDLSTARLTLADGDGTARRVALRIEPASPEVARALRFGVWMDGFEERSSGVLSGWVDAAGALLGIQISLDGAVRVGEYISDVGGPVASGRWAFVWTGSHRGFETIDGGMNWTREIALPEPIAEPRTGRDRSCGPLGCVIAGWLRVGWGSVEDAPPVDPPPPPPRPSHRPPSLTMDCARTGPQLAPDDIFGNGWAGHSQIGHGPAPSLRVLLHRPGGDADKFDEFTPFAGRSPAAVPAGYAGLTVEATHVLERGPRARALGRVYTWGPAAGDWESLGGWQVLWLWPWQASPSPNDRTRSSAASPPPWPTLEVARRAFGRGLGIPPDWSIVPGDDPDHALLVERRATLSTSVTGTGGGLLMLAALEADRPPVEVRPADGGPWPDLQGAVRSDGRWYIATAQRAGELAASVVWSLEGALAREAGRVARLAPDLSTPARLAARVGRVRAEGTATHVGLVVTGPDSDRGLSYWVSSFDPEARAFADPELLTPVDLSDRGASPCGGDDDGWEIEAPFPGTVDVRIGDAWSSRLQGAVARLRVWRGGACIDDIFGAVDSQASRIADAATPPAQAPPRVERNVGASATSATRTLAVTATTDRTRIRLRCRPRSP